MNEKIAQQNKYSGDSIRLNIKGYHPKAHPVPHGSEVDGVYFDGYPQVIKKDYAFEQIERVYQERDPNNWLIRVDPTFADLHSDPRWAEQMKKRGLAD